MEKPATTDHPIHEIIAKRWSPRAFSDETVPASHVLGLLEASRWAASCFNDQPWSFLVGFQGDETWQGVYDCLAEANRAWASSAPVLMLALAHENFVQTGKPNRHAQYDTGQAVAGMALEATARGLFLHQMAGFDADAARERFRVPEAHTPMTAIAVGHVGDPAQLPERYAAMERAPRERVPLTTFTFAGQWGQTAPFTQNP